MTVISINMTSVRAVAARLERDADALTSGCRDLTIPPLKAATSAEVGRAEAEWIGFLTEMRISVCATAEALLRVCRLFEDTDTHAEAPHLDRRPS